MRTQCAPCDNWRSKSDSQTDDQRKHSACGGDNQKSTKSNTATKQLTTNGNEGNGREDGADLRQLRFRKDYA